MLQYPKVEPAHFAVLNAASATLAKKLRSDNFVLMGFNVHQHLVFLPIELAAGVSDDPFVVARIILIQTKQYLSVAQHPMIFVVRVVVSCGEQKVEQV